jgi:hypothetical protein
VPQLNTTLVFVKMNCRGIRSWQQLLPEPPAYQIVHHSSRFPRLLKEPV